MSRLTISDTASRHLEAWADQVTRGELSIADLPRAIQTFVWIGHADGIAVAKRQAREYEHRLDQAYLQAYSPKDRREELQRRLDQHFRNVDAAFFAVDEGENFDNSNRVAA